MQKLPVNILTRNTHGDLMSLYTNDIDNISEALNNSLTNIFQLQDYIYRNNSNDGCFKSSTNIITVAFLALMSI